MVIFVILPCYVKFYNRQLKDRTAFITLADAMVKGLMLGVTAREFGVYFTAIPNNYGDENTLICECTLRNR
jgi:hypothetical protein